jgi:hypothetical protein
MIEDQEEEQRRAQDDEPIDSGDIVLGARQFPNPDHVELRTDLEGAPPTRTARGSRLEQIPSHSDAAGDISNPASAEILPSEMREASAGSAPLGSRPRRFTGVMGEEDQAPPTIASPSANDKTAPATLRGVLPASTGTAENPEQASLRARRMSDEASLKAAQASGPGISHLPTAARIPLRILEGVGSAVLPGVMANIPGTTLHHNLELGGLRGRLAEDVGEEEKLATAEHARSSAASLDRNDALNKALLTKGYTLGQDAQGNPQLIEVPGFQRDKVGTTPEELTLHDLMTGDNGKPRVNPDTKQPYTYTEAYSRIKQAAQDVKPTPSDTAIKHKMDMEAIGATAGVTGNPKTEKSEIDAARKSGKISDQQARDYLSFRNVEGTQGSKVDVTVAGQQSAEAIHRSDKLYAYADDQGKTQWAFGNKIPQGAQVMYEIKDPQMAVQGAKNMNIVEKSFTKLASHPAEMFDDPATRSVITTSLDENKAHSVGILVAGTGGSLTMPSGAGKIIDQLLQNNAVPEKYRKEAKDFIVDYYGMKDKMIALQQNLQGGKIGRLTAPALEAMFSQLPGVTTADSNMFRRQVGNLKSFINDAREDIPESYGTFKKAAEGGGESDTVRVQIPGKPPGAIKRDQLEKFQQKYPDAQVLP